MHKIIITNKNYKMVFGMLRKFFAHKNFLYWHNFDRHGKKRFSPILKIKNAFDLDGIEKYNTKKVLKNVTTVERDFNTDPFVPDPCFSVVCDPVGFGADNIMIGDEVYFCSNRIIVKQKFDYCKNYLYECYQILTDNDNIEDLPLYNLEDCKYIDDNEIDLIFAEDD